MSRWSSLLFLWGLSSVLFYVEFVISFVLCGVRHQFCFMWSLSSGLFYVEFVISFVLCGVCQKTFPIQNKKYLYNEVCLNQIILMLYWFCQFCVVHSSPGLFIPSTFTFNTSLQYPMVAKWFGLIEQVFYITTNCRYFFWCKNGLNSYFIWRHK